MIKIPILIPNQSEQYQITVADGLLARLSELFRFDAYSQVAVLTDTTIEANLLAMLRPSLPANALIISVAPGEQTKSIEGAATVWKQLLDHSFDRKSVLINFGGGVVGDLGGFIASTFMRGMDYINIPTTLLAQVDASVGGKTGVNFLGVKNIIGTFSQPKHVIIDIQTLATLPEREYISGFAEVLKHGLIHDEEYFRFATLKKPRDFTPQELMHIIERSVQIKAEIVTPDIHETTGRRKLLNFGHTFGHALEAIMLQLNTPILHGEAVALGMVVEAKLSELAGFITAADVERIRTVILQAGLPVVLSALQPATLMEKISHDKKNEYGKVKWTLLKRIGEAVADCEVSDIQINQAIEFALMQR